MANYRRELSKYEARFMHAKFQNHTNANGGIFTPDKRRKLLGLKPKQGKHHEDTADFWYDIKTTVKSGLKDFELFFDVASPEQIGKILEVRSTKDDLDKLHKISDPFEQETFWKSFPSLQGTLRALFRDYTKTRITKLKDGGVSKWVEPIDYDDSWKAQLADSVVQICLKFFREHRLISSKAHERLVDEMEDMLNVEVARGTQLPRSQRVKGYA